MAKSKKSKKTNTVALIAAVLVVVGLILVIVGMSIDWVVGGDRMFNLGDLADSNELYAKIAEESLPGYDAMTAFIYITMVLAIITLIGAAAGLVIKLKLIKLITAIAGALTIVGAVLTVVFAYTFCNADETKLFLLVTECAPAVGAWLLTVGGVIAGLGGLGCAAKS